MFQQMPIKALPFDTVYYVQYEFNIIFIILSNIAALNHPEQFRGFIIVLFEYKNALTSWNLVRVLYGFDKQDSCPSNVQ